MQNGAETPRLRMTEASETGRIEAFSDAVMAIAITLLVIELKVPHVDADHPSLGRALLESWASYLAYLVSFWSIGLAWMLHHNMFKLIPRADHVLLVLNTLFLLFIALVPYPTAIVAEYLESPGEQRTAMLIFSAMWLMVAIMINLLWWSARRHHLVVPGLDARVLRGITRRYLVGLLLYLLALALCLVSFEATMVVYVIVGVYYTLPGPDRIALAFRAPADLAD
jgi:uncharacterized membrane protein